jgi:hypothetical protein
VAPNQEVEENCIMLCRGIRHPLIVSEIVGMKGWSMGWRTGSGVCVASISQPFQSALISELWTKPSNHI